MHKISQTKSPISQMIRAFLPLSLTLLALLSSCKPESSNRQTQLPDSDELYQYNDNLAPRWSSPENINGAKGQGGRENYGAKGHPSDAIEAGQSRVLLDVQGQGIIQRIWITVMDRYPEMLRSLKLEMFWDNETQPAVSVPFGDFFGVGLGRTATFENALFANAEGRSFNCFIPMPFRKGAKMVVTNESGKRLSHIFFDIDYSLVKNWHDDNLYFHAYWHRDTATTMTKDFELLPHVTGKGRFLGVNVGINANPVYGDSWWGEGEVKMYLDGDNELPTLVGTGTEDYIGDAWGQGEFINKYTGCPIADNEKKQWAFYRYHIPDPVYFGTDCRVTIQQIGANNTEKVAALQQAKVPLILVTIDDLKKIHHLYKKDSTFQLHDPTLLNRTALFYRSDDVSATAYFYLNTPASNLPALQPVALRTANLKSQP